LLDQKKLQIVALVANFFSSAFFSIYDDCFSATRVPGHFNMESNKDDVSAGKRTVILVMYTAVVGLVTAGAILYAFGPACSAKGHAVARLGLWPVADSSIYIAILPLVIAINLAITSPALLVLQPLRLRWVLCTEKVVKNAVPALPWYDWHPSLMIVGS
jgi:hypothetical protein